VETNFSALFHIRDTKKQLDVFPGKTRLQDAVETPPYYPNGVIILVKT
jgi:hypothetical protein